MDSYELNKIIGAILGTLLFVMGVGFLAEAIYHPITDNGPGYMLPVGADTGTGDTTTPDAPTAVSIGTLLASADPVAGQASAKKCQSCHDFTKGGPNKTGPNLYGIVGEQIAATPGYTFSAALQAHASETWTYENLNGWLTSPKGWAPGTKMAFAGIKDDAERANVIAYLSTLSESPVPFPPADAASEQAAPPSEQVTEGTSSAEAPTETPSTMDEPGMSSSEAAPASSEAPVSSEASMAASSEMSSAAQ